MVWGLVFFSAAVNAGELRVAVASNFLPTLKRLAVDFEKDSGHRLLISSGSSGKLFAQIKQGAPYDVFLSADALRPDRLVSDGLAGSDYVYALGRLVLLSNIVLDDCRDVLHSDRLKRLAIANPGTAPYGRAAQEVLQAMGLWHELQPKLVKGENIMQAYQFVATRNAQAGFIAGSLLRSGKMTDSGCIWEVPAELHAPVRQKLIRLEHARGKAAAGDFLRYMKSPRARDIIRASGYDVLTDN